MKGRRPDMLLQPDLRRLHSSFAAEVLNVDLSAPLSAEDALMLRSWLDTYAVLVFPRQTVTDGGLVRFARALGGTLRERQPSAASPRRLREPAVRDISNLDARGALLSPAEYRQRAHLNSFWHTDASYRRPCGLHTALAAHVVPRKGGETEFSDLVAAYADLSDAAKQRLCGLAAEHSLARLIAFLGMPVEHPPEFLRENTARWPLIRAVDAHGSKSLYLAANTMRVCGFSDEESGALIAALVAHASQERFVYRHRWAPGEIAVWDNRRTMHRGLSFDSEQEVRDMRAVTTMCDE